MNLEPIPIELFCKNVFFEKRVAKLARELHLDPERVAPLLRDHFVEMGVFYVKPHRYFHLIVDQAVLFIKTSPEIRKILGEMRDKEERLRTQRRVEKMSA